MNILIIKLGASGDVLRTTAILPGLKQKYKDAKITWITAEYNKDLLKNNRLIDNTIVFNNKLKDTIKEAFDMVISLDDEKEVCQLASAIKTKSLIGSCFDRNNNQTYTEDTEPWFGMGLLRPKSKGGKEKADQLKKENKKTVQDILYDILELDKQYNEITLTLDKNNKTYAEAFAHKNNLTKKDNIIGLNTGAGKRWPAKRLSEEKTIELIKALQKQNPEVKLILFGGPEEEERNQNILKQTKEVIDAGCNNSLLNFAALINICNTLITSDTLALHIAIALQKHVIAFFAPTSAAEIELYGRGTKIIAKSECYCCYKKEKTTCNDAIDIKEIVKEIR